MTTTSSTGTMQELRGLLKQWEDPTADWHHTAKDVAVLRELIEQSVDGLAWLDQWDMELAEWEADIEAGLAPADIAAIAEMDAAIARGEL